MKNAISLAIAGFIIGLVIGGTGGYLYASNYHKTNFNARAGFGNSQIDAQTRNDIAAFFDNTSDIRDIRNYCNTDRQYCFYYCRSINPSHPICGELGNFTSRQGGKASQ